MFSRRKNRIATRRLAEINRQLEELNARQAETPEQVAASMFAWQADYERRTAALRAQTNADTVRPTNIEEITR